MKKLSYIIGCLFLMLFVWVSCDNEDNRMQTTGYLELGVSKNVEVVTRGFDVKTNLWQWIFVPERMIRS